MKTEQRLRFDVELLTTGPNKHILEQRLHRIKGLSAAPETIVKGCPCIIATNISGNASQQLQRYLGKLGAHVAIRKHGVRLSLLSAEKKNSAMPSTTQARASDLHEQANISEASIVSEPAAVAPPATSAVVTFASRPHKSLEPSSSDARHALATTSITLKRSIGELTRALEDRDWTVREHAIVELGNVPSDTVLRHIIKALKDDVWHVRCTALDVLSKVGAEAAIRDIARCLRDSVWHVRYQAVESLSYIHSDKAIRSLTLALDDENWQVRRRAVQALGDLRSNRGLGGVIACLRDDVWHVRESAARALGKIRSEKAVKALMTSLHDPNWHVRSMVISALWQIGTERAVNALIERLQDEEWMVHWKAAYALRKIGTLDILPVFAWLEKDRNPLVSDVAKQALHSLDIVTPPRQRAIPRLEYRSEDAYANMMYIPPGPFMMGDDDGADNAAPAHEVHVSGFLIDAYEVTNIQYHHFDSSHRFEEGEEHHPVVNVPWKDACAYAEWIGKRLPTEAEWEKAARGMHGLPYPWGVDFEPMRGNTEESAMRHLTPVNHYPTGRSPFGVYDMFGNVLEWTSDSFQPYPGSRYESPDAEEGFIVLRGASWIHAGAQFSCATRMYAPPENSSNFIGFRCVKNIR